jgi:hypothetical protein
VPFLAIARGKEKRRGDQGGAKLFSSRVKWVGLARSFHRLMFDSFEDYNA